MGTKVTKKVFQQILSEEFPKFFGALGFTESAPGAFTRELGELSHGFGLTPNPSYTHFHVPVGVDVPNIRSRADYVVSGGAHYRTLLVSRWLGEFKPKYRRNDIYYHFATVEEMRGKVPQVYSDFVEQAEPWLTALTTVEAVAKEFYKWRIAPPLTGETRTPDPFVWAMYGWLLTEAQRPGEARPWLERAYDFLQLPRYMKAGQLVRQTGPGARLVPRIAEEDRLMELLRKDLGLSVSLFNDH